MKDNNEDELVTDKLDLNDEIERFDKIINSTGYNVYGFSGDWGIGKTTFIKLWENLKDNYDYIHIDAFKEDYHSDPLVTLINSFTSYFKNHGNTAASSITKIQNSGKELLLKTLKSTGKLGLNIILDKTVGNANAKEFVSTILDDVYGSVFNDTNNVKDIIKDIQTELKLNLESRERELIVVVDELDRCRPDYALELLEKIKHIFSIKNLKFIIIYNPIVLTSIVEKKYGFHDQSHKYIMKFIEKEIIYPQVQSEYNWYMEEVKNNSDKFNSGYSQKILISYAEKILLIKKEFNLSLRDIERFISNLKSYQPSTMSQSLNYIVIELLRLINYKELQGMIEYSKHNSNFAINAPDKSIYDRIYKSLSEDGQNEIKIDYKDFYNYARGLLY